jgi:hypothetical protein
MTATVIKTPDNTYRAVCRDEACRTNNAQRTYWRTWHTSEVRARSLAADHNRSKHGAK